MPTAPTTEQGQVSDRGLGPGLLPWSSFIDDTEYVPELQWPNSIEVYDRMNADAQVSGLLRGVSLPLQQREWCLDPNGATEESVTRLADELGLPILGQDPGPRRRRRGRFSFRRHIVDALRALMYGHYYFEQVGTIQQGRWQLRKLAPRPPRTITEIKVAEDGGLVSIKQALGFNSPELSVDRLVAYVWDQEAGNWVGRSMLRPLYKNWVIKDRLLRVDAIKHERGANGAPVIEAPPGATPDQIAELAAMAQSMKITERGGGAVPAGAKLAGNSGPSATDTIGSVRFHNEEMAGAFLAMFKQLGQTYTGSRALGETFVDFFSLALDAVQEWVMDVFDQHVIEDWYDWNYGEDSQPAVLAIDEEPEPAQDIGPLQNQVQDGNVQMDPSMMEQIGVDPTEVSARRTRSSARRKRRRRSSAPAPEASAAAESPPPLPLPARKLRRQPYEHEIAAAVDYATMDVTLTSKIAELVHNYKISVQAARASEIEDGIKSADGDLGALAALSVQESGSHYILKAMEAVHQEALAAAQEEAVRQGITPKAPTAADLKALTKSAEARAGAVDTVLGRTYAEAASRQAIRGSTQGVDAGTVAANVRGYLEGLSDKYLEDQFNGVLTQAMNDARRAVMKRNNPTRLYASELLDTNTCENCLAIDGTQYDQVEDTLSDYPGGGYIDCLGQERCRGTIVAVYDER